MFGLGEQVHAAKVTILLIAGTVLGAGRNQNVSVPDAATVADGTRLLQFTISDGLVDNGVMSILEDQQGRLYFGTWNGVNRFDGKQLTSLHGLSGKNVYGMLEDSKGHLWFAAALGEGGVTRYDGESYKTFTTADGLAHNSVTSILEDRQGNLWFGTGRWTGAAGGVSRYDGESFTTFTTRDGLAGDRVWSMLEEREGHLWFGTYDGVSRYDGDSFESFTTGNGLPNNLVLAIEEDDEGHLWFGTSGGVSRYDGESFTTYTTANGLPDNNVLCILEDDNGHLWFGTYGGGVSRYDGRVFQHLSRKDGLTHDAVQEIHQDREGSIWIATEGGVTRYQPASTPPTVHLDVIADRRHGPAEEIRLPSSQELLIFEFQGRSLTTRPDEMVYLYRLAGVDEDWRQTREGRVEYAGLNRGDYTFEVKAVDRDLNYSEPVAVHFQIHLPYERLSWFAALSLAVLLVAWQSARVARRDRRLQASNEELSRLNADLQDANQQIQQANQHKSQFLARMSHDLRTPMNAIVGYTRILQRRLKGSIEERQYQNLENINTSADHLLSLINDILDLSKIEAGGIEIRPERVDLASLVSNCMNSVRPLVRDGVAFTEHLEQTPPVQTDPDRLQRVVMNLLGNAVKFTEEGSITVSLRPADEWVELSVADTGPGIPAQDLPFIFDEFRQVEGEQKQGTGLGLSIAKKSVELLGGTISVESSIGEGATFALLIRNYEPQAG